MAKKQAREPMVRRNITLTRPVVAFLEREALRTGLSVSDLIRRAVERFSGGLDRGDDSRVHPEREPS